MLSCYNYLCVYQRDYTCHCGSVSINEAGLCAEAEVVFIAPEQLESLKRASLEEPYPYEDD